MKTSSGMGAYWISCRLTSPKRGKKQLPDCPGGKTDSLFRGKQTTGVCGRAGQAGGGVGGWGVSVGRGEGFCTCVRGGVSVWK